MPANPRRSQIPRNALPSPRLLSATLSTDVPEALPTTDSTDLTLRRGSTFHASVCPSSPSSDPILHIPSLPRRSPTCPQSLDAIVTAGERERRLVDFLGSVDQSLANTTRSRPSSYRPQSWVSGEDLPLPRGMLDVAVSSIANIPHPNMSPPSGRGNGNGDHAQQIRRRTRNPHASDSGLGSTIGSSAPTTSSGNGSMRSHSAITRSVSTIYAGTTLPHHTLSVQAAKKIQEIILLPLLSKPDLRDFHPLIRDVPRRINEKEILCLRDLEKTLVFLAPDRAKSAKAYLAFCETSIQCIHTTVEHLSERDQRRPADAPYTNGYFLDLVGQVRQYASEMAASRERQAAGEAGTDREPSPSEKVELRGGLSQTGRPARLVRVKDGISIPLGRSGAEDEEADAVYEEGRISSKRSRSEETAQDSVRRSMARRRKLAPGEVVTEPPPQMCGMCSKQFKRPCDLTKHEKTHTRPWKCPEAACKYHGHGWPTEKERDRHVNDKHSTEPELFQCQYQGCAYKSKRESNCKQHMEKTHGWTYTRVKGNAKKIGSESAQPTPQTPAITTPASFSLPTPTTDNSPYLDQTMGFGPSGFSMGASPSLAEGADGVAGPSGFLTAETNFPFQFAQPVQPLDDSTPVESSPSEIGYDQSFHLSSLPMPVANASAAGYDALNLGDDAMLGMEAIDWNSLNDLDAWNAQLMTPDQSVEQRTFGSFSEATDFAMVGPSYPTGPSRPPHLSPGGHANMMLSSPKSAIDDELAAFKPAANKPYDDFTLFSSNGSSSMESANDGMFPNLTDYEHQPHRQPWQGQYLQGGVGAMSSGLGLSQTSPFDELMDLDKDLDEGSD